MKRILNVDYQIVSLSIENGFVLLPKGHEIVVVMITPKHLNCTGSEYINDLVHCTSIYKECAISFNISMDCFINFTSANITPKIPKPSPTTRQ